MRPASVWNCTASEIHAPGLGTASIQCSGELVAVTDDSFSIHTHS